MVMARHWETFRLRWIPAGLVPSQEHQARTIVSSVILFSTVAALYSLLYAFMELWPLIVSNGLAISACIAALPVLRHRGPGPAANLCITGGWLCLTSGLLISGGYETRSFFWLLSLPLGAGLLGGLRTGVVWTAVTALTMAGLIIAHTLAIPLPLLVPIEQPAAIPITQAFGILTLIALTMVVFLRNQAWAEAKAQEAIAGLRAEVESRKLAERAAQDADQAKSEFLAMMSHELRTPMNGVLGMAQLLLQTQQTPNQRMFTETIQGSGEVLLQLLNDILDFSKIEAGRLDLEHRTFSLRGSLESLGELMASRAQEKGVELLLDLDPGMPTHITGDETRIRQMVLNLLSNAIKFTQEGEVVLSVVEEGDRLRFSVRDTGIGIPAEAQTRLFTAFTQADCSTTRRFGGTGLGLAIVRSLCTMMGGEVGLESTPGVGSTFWFTIAHHVPAQPPAPIAPPEALIDRRVLVVDDNPTNRLILLRELEHWGMAVVVCESAAEALALLRAQARRGTPFELAILDMQMPDTDGLQLAREIEDDPAIRGVSRLLLSSMGMRIPEPDAEAAGLKRQLFKPVRSEVLQDALLELCGQWVSPTPTAVPASAAEKGTGRVLIVEDNSVNQLVTRHFLSTLGYESAIAEHGQVALELLAVEVFDLVLMDVHMPVLDGHETTRHIRGVMGLTLPIIGLTASAMAEDRQRCLDSGMCDYLTKPLEIEALSDMLERHSLRMRAAS